MNISDIEFLREHAKAGIHHNYTDPKAHMSRLNDIINQLIIYSRSNGLFKNERLEKENESLKLALSNIIKAAKGDNTNRVFYAIEDAQDLIQ